MIRPCYLPPNSKIGSIGSVEPVRSVTVKLVYRFVKSGEPLLTSILNERNKMTARCEINESCTWKKNKQLFGTHE